MKALLDNARVTNVQTHMCQFGMQSHIDRIGGDLGLVKKPTGFMTSSRCVLQELGKRCSGDHDHVPLVGGRDAGAQVYPQALCEAICLGVAAQKKSDK